MNYVLRTRTTFYMIDHTLHIRCDEDFYQERVTVK